MLPHREAFYGGAAGGGKSDALLMAALQYVDVPRYSALLFRKTLTDLQLEEALIPRSHQWLSQSDAHWNGSLNKWTFPSGAVLQFGYLNGPMDRYRYQSSAFQFIGFDELTQHWEWDYTYLFSRLRRGHCPEHQQQPNPNCPTCREFAQQSKIPLRVRSASNPGGVGHGWVQERFQIERVGPIYRGTHPQRPHIPAFISDNPFLDQGEYIESLQELDPITREQLLNGDWGVSPDSRFRRSWAKYYGFTDDHLVIVLEDGRTHYVHDCVFFQTIDPAASVREGPADALLWQREPSWTVISTWCITPQWDLLLWDVDRFQAETPEVLQRIRMNCRKHATNQPGSNLPKVMGSGRLLFVGVEANGLGIGLFQLLAAEGFPVKDLRPASQDKLVRATTAANQMERGKVFFPREKYAPWLRKWEQEIFTWTGDPKETADQVDTLAYAGICFLELVTSCGASLFEVPNDQSDHTPMVVS